MVAKWVVILQIPAEYGALPGKAKGNEMNYVVVECLVVKSAKVLQLRAGSWMVFLKWAMGDGQRARPVPPQAGGRRGFPQARGRGGGDQGKQVPHEEKIGQAVRPVRGKAHREFGGHGCGGFEEPRH